MSHYFDERPSRPSQRTKVTLALPDVSLDLDADRGVFSAARIDPGTLVLLESAPKTPSSGDLLDLGCGYGPIALTLARRAPAAQIWAVDVNERALELVRHNVSIVGVDNVEVCRPEQVPEHLTFDAIYSNPPVRIGKAQLHALLSHWLDRLSPDGRAALVVQKHLGSDSLASWLNEQGYPTRRLVSRRGYRVLETLAGRASSDG